MIAACLVIAVALTGKIVSITPFATMPACTAHASQLESRWPVVALDVRCDRGVATVVVNGRAVTRKC